MRCCGVVNDGAFNSRVAADIADAASRGAELSASTTIQVQVIFHICYTITSTAEVDADIAWSLQQLNADFNGQATNKDQFDGVFSGDLLTTYNEYKSRMGCMNVNFVKRQVVYKSVRPQSSTNLSVLDSTIKAQSVAIDPTTSLNIWIADLSSNILGYAQFPWDTTRDTQKYDGVLLARSAFGRNSPSPKFNMNKTMTHEVGHWFGLYHTFQTTFSYKGGNVDYAPGTNPEESKGDCVIDTPPQLSPNFGNPFLTPLTWPTSQPTDEAQAHRAMFFNFMDYVDDVSMFMYTADQVKKMRLMVQLYRPNVITAVLPPPPPPPVQPVVPAKPYYRTNFSNSLDNALWKLTSAVTAKFGNNVFTLRNAATATRTLDFNSLKGYVSTLRAVVTYKSSANSALQVTTPGKKTASTLTLQPTSTWRTTSLRVAVSSLNSGLFTVTLRLNVRNGTLEVQEIQVE